MLNQIKSNLEKVEDILNKYQETRDSDKLLWLSFMCIHHDMVATLNGGYSGFKKLLMEKGTPTFESLSRARRKIQEEKPYLQATSKVKEAREEAENDVREFFSR